MPVICGRQIHLATLYGIVMKAGGSAHVNQAKSWPLIANSLGFTGPNDATAPVELAHAYMNLVAPFEEFLKVRQTNQRSASQAMQQHLSPNDPSRQNSPVTPSPVGNRPPMTQSQSFENLQAVQVQPVHVQPGQMPPNSMVSPHTNFQSPSPVQTNRMGSQQPQPPIGVSPRHMTPDMSVSRSPSVSTQAPPSRSNSLSVAAGGRTRADTLNSDMPPPKQVAPSPGPLRKMSDIPPPVPSPVSKPVIKPLVKLPAQDGKYLPKKRKRAADGGYNISELLRTGADVDTLVPDFPLFQELGTVEINSIIMALQSMIPGEVRQALDKLALLSSNPAVGISLRECPGLVTALGMVGMDLLNNLKAGKKVCTVDVLTGNAPGDEAVDYESEKDLICSVFNTYRNWDDRNDDVVVQIDSLTGEPVEAAKDDDEAIETLNSIISADDDDFRQEDGTPDGGFGNMETTGKFGFAHYQDMLDASKEEANAMHREPKSQLGTFWQDALADRFLCVTLILRNLSFADINQPVIVQDAGTLKLLFEMVRALANHPKLLGSMRRKLCLQKDLVTLFANLGLYISIPTAADAFSVLLLVLSFAPEDTPYRSANPGDKHKQSMLMFAEYSPVTHRYLSCAIDALAKLIARDPPNRGFFEEIFLNICTDEEYLILLNRFLEDRPPLQPFEFLTRAFALAIASFPRTDFRVIPKALEIRRPLLQQSLLIAETLVSVIPAPGALDDLVDIKSAPDQYAAMMTATLQAQRQSNVALEWLDAAEGFGPTLLRAACALGGIANPRAGQRGAVGVEVNPFAKITQRSISVLRILTEKAMAFEVASLNNTDLQSSTALTPQLSTTTGSSTTATSLVTKTQAKLPGKIFPTLESLLGAMLSGTMNDTVVRHLCSLSEDRASFLATLQKLER